MFGEKKPESIKQPGRLSFYGYGGSNMNSQRDRAETKTEEEWHNMVKKLQNGDEYFAANMAGRNYTLLGSINEDGSDLIGGRRDTMEESSENKDIIKAGEMLLYEYKRNYAIEIFNKSILNCFINMFEAGYLYKFKNIVWETESSEKEESVVQKPKYDDDMTPHSSNLSYKHRKSSFKLRSNNNTAE